MPAKSNTITFTKRANKKHNNYYDYSLAEYINAKEKVKIICPKHGEFLQQPSNHLFGQGCIKCMGDRVSKAKRLNTSEFILKSKAIHGSKYDYSLVEYKTSKDKVIIICPEHGEFLQTPKAHSTPSMCQGCPFCKISKGEEEIEKYLIKNHIAYLREKRFDGCINPKTNKTLPFDFYLPNNNTIIEYQGEQHYKDLPFFKTGGGLKGRQYRDSIKKSFVKSKGILYIEVSYKQYKDINNILKQQI
tara:strand:- start:245 stop:979 length:735 start_codon:yes stop_codon:yes gene_type:complete